jgi:hypothetical protein
MVTDTHRKKLIPLLALLLALAGMCIFWPIPITDSGLIRSPILDLCDH